VIVALLTLSLAAAEPNGHESRLALTAGSPWGLELQCNYLYRGPCGAPLSAGVRFEHELWVGHLGELRQSLSAGAGLEAQALLGGGAHLALGAQPFGLLRWGLCPAQALELSVSAELGAQLFPSAFQVAGLFVNASLAVRFQLTSRWFVALEAGPFAGRLLAGVSW
jgi:hypothetical protein